MIVAENAQMKIARSAHYNYDFHKGTGLHLRWGKTREDDPQVAPAPEILDIEISTGCERCTHCYKAVPVSEGKQMSLGTFSVILDKFPKALTQLALGLTSIDANPDLIPIMEYARSKGVVPNFTTSGHGLSGELLDETSNLAGAVAVSAYPHNRQLAYATIKAYQEHGVEQTNMHLLYYQENRPFVESVLRDVAAGTVEPNAVVLLALKQKGRGSNLTPVTQAQFEELATYALDHNIPLGFDSCSAPRFEEWAVKNGKDDLLMYSDRCESGCFSAYCNVDGEFFPCSFAEGAEGWETGIPILGCDSFDEVWNHDRVKAWRNRLLDNDRVCPIYKV